MKVSLLLKDDRFRLITKELNNLDITGIYSCDLLSWVMGHAMEGDAWCTVLTHNNIVAVASLLKLSCIIVCENAPIDDDTVEKADKEGINIITTALNSVEVIKKLLSGND